MYPLLLFIYLCLTWCAWYLFLLFLSSTWTHLREISLDNWACHCYTSLTILLKLYVQVSVWVKIWWASALCTSLAPLVVVLCLWTHGSPLPGSLYYLRHDKLALLAFFLMSVTVNSEQHCYSNLPSSPPASFRKRCLLFSLFVAASLSLPCVWLPVKLEK